MEFEIKQELDPKCEDLFEVDQGFNDLKCYELDVSRIKLENQLNVEFDIKCEPSDGVNETRESNELDISQTNVLLLLRLDLLRPFLLPGLIGQYSSLSF